MNDYQQEQHDALNQASTYLNNLTDPDTKALQAQISTYIDFRAELDEYLALHCGDFCTSSCYTSKTSACCSKDGIITFWADVLINALYSNEAQLRSLMKAIQGPAYDGKCIYLSTNGCLWHIRPLVCAMFLCDPVQQGLSEKDDAIRARWQALNQQAKSFRWPDRPVLFDQLEQCCLVAGIQSSLMYLHNSPGLLRIKQQAGLTTISSGAN